MTVTLVSDRFDASVMGLIRDFVFTFCTPRLFKNYNAAPEYLLRGKIKSKNHHVK